jgi:hypothetical protein
MLPVTSADLVFGVAPRNGPHMPDRQGGTRAGPSYREDADSEDTLKNGSTSALGKGSRSMLDDLGNRGIHGPADDQITMSMIYDNPPGRCVFQISGPCHGDYSVSCVLLTLCALRLAFRVPLTVSHSLRPYRNFPHRTYTILYTVMPVFHIANHTKPDTIST